ncbi:MAG: hypothetical protein AB7V08_02330 [Elusimicrobiales bacterium]
MKSFTSLLAWLLMAAVLAVPSFLFYNWWSNSKKQVSAEISQDPGTVPPVFQSEGGAQAAQPAQAAPQPPDAAPAAQPAPESAAPQQRPPSAASQAPEPAPAAQPAGQAEAAPAAQPEDQPEDQPAAQQGVEGSTVPKPVSYYEPKTERDPTFTPDDYKRIRDEAMRRAEAERMSRNAERYKPREPGPETRVVLQGIVGNAAIVNGDMYTVGQTVRGVKIVKVGADYIICDYKGKKFRKVLK